MSEQFYLYRRSKDLFHTTQCIKCNTEVKINDTSFSSDIDECATGTHSCSVDAVCNNIKGAYNCTCKPGYQGDGRECQGNNLMWRIEENILIL